MPCNCMGGPFCCMRRQFLVPHPQPNYTYPSMWMGIIPPSPPSPNVVTTDTTNVARKDEE